MPFQKRSSTRPARFPLRKQQVKRRFLNGVSNLERRFKRRAATLMSE
jgi:hypothetical protein